jgi:hypothetical protein
LNEGLIIVGITRLVVFGLRLGEILSRHSEAVNKSKIHRKDAKVQRNRKVNTLFAKAFFALPLPLCASAVGG